MEFIGSNTLLLRLQATPQTQPNERYVVELKVDQGQTKESLPLEAITFDQREIADRVTKTIPFELSTLSLAEAFIAEAFVDPAIADVSVQDVVASVGSISEIELRMNVGSGGLAGFNVEWTIADPMIAMFTGAFFPPDFPLADTVPDPVLGHSFRSRGVDLGSAVNAGDLAVPLVTALVEPLAVEIVEVMEEIAVHGSTGIMADPASRERYVKTMMSRINAAKKTS